MGRTVFANASLYDLGELDNFYKNEVNKRIAERILCIIWSIDEKITAKEISLRLRRDPQSVRMWIRDYNKNGIEGLKPVFNGGRKSKLSHDDEEFIIGLLDQNPEDYGYFSQVWDCILLAAVFSEKHDVELHKDVVWRMFRRRGYSFKMPEKTNPKADPELKKKKKRDLIPWKKR